MVSDLPEMELQVTLSNHMSAGNEIQVILKNSVSHNH